MRGHQNTEPQKSSLCSVYVKKNKKLKNNNRISDCISFKLEILSDYKRNAYMGDVLKIHKRKQTKKKNPRDNH